MAKSLVRKYHNMKYLELFRILNQLQILKLADILNFTAFEANGRLSQYQQPTFSATSIILKGNLEDIFEYFSILEEGKNMFLY